MRQYFFSFFAQGAWMTGDTYLMNLDFMERVDDGKLASEGEEDDSDDKKDGDKTGHSSEEELVLFVRGIFRESFENV